MRISTIAFGAVLMFFVSCACAVAELPAASVDPQPAGPIASVLVREKYVLATDSLSIYRASLADKIWHVMHPPAEMPLGGAFVVPPTEQAKGDVVLFCSVPPEMALIIDNPKSGQTHLAQGDEARGNGRYGIYRSADGGDTWKLLSDRYDFQFVFWHPDNTLYALAGKKGFVNPTRVYHSKDGGVTWDDITNGLDSAGYGGLTGIFLDPDQPASICLSAQGVRGYVIHANGATGRWIGEQETEWERQHFTDEKFLATNYAFSGIDSISDYLFMATFANYFSYPFGNSTQIDAFELRTEHAAYTFDQHGPKPVHLTMRFRPADHAAISNDVADAADFFGLRLIGPAGERHTVTPKAEALAEKDPGVQKEYNRRKDICRLELTVDHPYTRQIDLDQLFSFPAPGIYRVQVVYSSPWWASEGRTHWTGSFGGNVMTVTIK